MSTEQSSRRSAIAELLAYVDGQSTMRSFFASPNQYKELEVPLKRFLTATMDQVRVNCALECTGRILKISDLEELEFFREGVWKREATGAIKYPAQRDHTAHTLNNWLLGWYFYDKVAPIRKGLADAIARRNWSSPTVSADQFFGHTWLFTSLLHDIGYLFEGSLSTMETGSQSSQAEIGLRAADEYFHFGFWKHTKLGATDDRTVVADESACLPQMPAEPSLTRIAVYLRSLEGDMSVLLRMLKRRSVRAKGPVLPLDGLPGDAFELWKAHFRCFKQDAVADRIESLEAAFLEDVTKGMPGIGVRILDHGVCSGLLQLKISTFFYRLFASLEHKVATKTTKRSVARSAKKLIDRELGLDNPCDYEFWWSGVVWATASAALHNMQQRGGRWCAGHEPQPLKLDEEPLTYLGVLVDCLQDWDRYFVFDLPSRSPVQGIDVQLAVEGGKAVVALPPEMKEQASKLRKDLNKALHGWEHYVVLLPEEDKKSS